MLHVLRVFFKGGVVIHYDAITFEPVHHNRIGQVLTVCGSIIGSIGTIFISIGMFKPAYTLWAISNPLLLVWCLGEGRWWEGELSTKMLAVMYGIYIVFNTYALLSMVG